jgi:hypothetical protein
MAIKLFQYEYFVLDFETEHNEKNTHPKSLYVPVNNMHNHHNITNCGCCGHLAAISFVRLQNLIEKNDC